MKRALAFAIATVCGAGFLPKSPGTFGTLAAVPFYVALTVAADGSKWVSLWVGVGLFPVGIWAASIVGAESGEHDDQRIVVDELIGFFVALAGVAPSIAGVVAAFIWFRFFDILKPFPVGAIDRGIKTSAGTMLDDVAAGMLACGATHVTLYALAQAGFA